jgi:hypothetical protein
MIPNDNDSVVRLESEVELTAELERASGQNAGRVQPRRALPRIHEWNIARVQQVRDVESSLEAPARASASSGYTQALNLRPESSPRRCPTDGSTPHVLRRWLT